MESQPNGLKFLHGFRTQLRTPNFYTIRNDRKNECIEKLTQDNKIIEVKGRATASEC